MAPAEDSLLEIAPVVGDKNVAFTIWRNRILVFTSQNYDTILYVPFNETRLSR